MSLILEALNKAEQNKEASSNYNTPPPYPTEKTGISKRILLLLIATVGLTSAVVTFLIFYNFSSSDKPTHTASNNTQASTPAIVNNMANQAAIQKQNTIPAYKNPITPISTNKGSSKSTPSPEGNNFIINREPSLHSLVKNPTRSEAKKQTSTKTSNHKENAPIKTAVTYTTTTDLDTQTTDNQPEIKNITGTSSLEMSNIKIDVHMYDKNPTKRFVYINSARHGEGAMISDGVFLNEITKNGIVINNNGTLYRVPIKL